MNPSIATERLRLGPIARWRTSNSLVSLRPNHQASGGEKDHECTYPISDLHPPK